MKTLVQQSEVFGPISPENEPYKRLVDAELKGDEEIDERLGTVLISLWNDHGIQVSFVVWLCLCALVQATYEQRAHFQLSEFTKYFMDRLPEVPQFGCWFSCPVILRS